MLFRQRCHTTADDSAVPQFWLFGGTSAPVTGNPRQTGQLLYRCRPNRPSASRYHPGKAQRIDRAQERDICARHALHGFMCRWFGNSLHRFPGVTRNIGKMPGKTRSQGELPRCESIDCQPDLRESFSPLPARINGVHLSIRASLVFDCFGAAK